MVRKFQIERNVVLDIGPSSSGEPLITSATSEIGSVRLADINSSISAIGKDMQVQMASVLNQGLSRRVKGFDSPVSADSKSSGLQEQISKLLFAKSCVAVVIVRGTRAC